MILQYRSDNELWGTALASTLAGLGVRYVVISPGSRSTPLVLALTGEKPLRCISVLDERSAGFLALGIARATLEPVVVVTTSGTAVANLLPAVVEARESRVPLLLLTADRPPELRECQSGQTIDQVKIFGGYPIGYHELMLPEATSAAVSCLRQVLVHAWSVAKGKLPGMGGPYHLNIPLRDPLVPPADAAWQQMEWQPPVERVAFSTEATVELPASFWQKRGLIVAGASIWTPSRRAQVRELSKRLGWPVLADTLSGLRDEQDWEGLIAGYDLALRNAEFAAAMAPQVVLQIGSLPTSKVLRQRLQEWDPELWVMDPAVRNLNALHLRAQELPIGIEELKLDSISSGQEQSEISLDYLNHWSQCEAWCRENLRQLLGENPNFEARWVNELTEFLSHDPGGQVPVMVGNSMPVRDWEYFRQPGVGGGVTFCNRGANGIDGQLSTAVGLAEDHGRAVLVSGDLSLLHDTNGLLHHRRMQGELLVLLIDNSGGGIFRHLPVQAVNPPFDEFFLTPQQVDWPLLAGAYGIEIQDLPVEKSWKPFLEFTGRKGIRILRWLTNSESDARLRMEAFRRLAAKLPENIYL